MSFSILGGFPTENDIVSSESLQHRNKLISPSIELTRAFTNGPNTKPEGTPELFVNNSFSTYEFRQNAAKPIYTIISCSLPMW